MAKVDCRLYRLSNTQALKGCQHLTHEGCLSILLAGRIAACIQHGSVKSLAHWHMQTLGVLHFNRAMHANVSILWHSLVLPVAIIRQHLNLAKHS